MAWKTARRSANNGACVEVEAVYGNSGQLEAVHVRDNKFVGIDGYEPPIMRFTPDEWESLTSGVKTSPEKVSTLIMGRTVSIELPGGTIFRQTEVEPGWVEWAKSDQPDVIQLYSAGRLPDDRLSEVGAAVLGMMEDDFTYSANREDLLTSV